MRFLPLLVAFLLVSLTSRAVADGEVTKAVLDTAVAGENLLKADRFGRYEQGFEAKDGTWACDNGGDATARRGVVQSIELNQTRPEPIVATAESKAEGVTGSADPDYSLYLDLQYADGTPLYGQSAAFAIGTHDWQARRVVVLPEKPVKRLSFYMLFRGHSGKASFRNPALRVVGTPQGATLFDGVPVVVRQRPKAGFQVRDVAAGSDFVSIEREALGLKLDVAASKDGEVEFFDVTLSDTSGKDRAVTLLYAVPVGSTDLRWFHDPRRESKIEPGREYVDAGRFHAGNGRLLHYPLGCVAGSSGPGVALGIDMSRPAFFRIGHNAGSGELFLAYDLGLAKEKPSVRLRFCRFPFDSAWGFRGALAMYYGIYKQHFRCRTPEQGLWMPFAPISKVKGWEDFGFKFKEGNDETAWDDAHGIITFRYTEPMTWWMTMPKQMPRTLDAAVAEARRLAEKGDRHAQALLTSGYHNEAGQMTARLLDTPWCNGAVWSMNSMPGIAGDATDFSVKWNAKLREQLYKSPAGLDGEYVDSSEGYVTDELDFRRDHFAVADTPLCFSPESHRPAIFRGLIAFEYVRGIARDVHAMNKLMMANGAPTQLCWLCPMVEVLGTETDWNHRGRWSPMSDADLLYRRALCKGKPYCFLMNTEFERFGPDLVEKYMKRSLAYGMFPGFFSHNASQGHYFSRPELYDRDRPLFRRYMPLCKRVAQAGWTPITAARSSDDRVYVERFGDGATSFLTVFNDSPQRRTATIALDRPAASGRELLKDAEVRWSGGKTQVTLDGEDVAVIEVHTSGTP